MTKVYDENLRLVLASMYQDGASSPTYGSLISGYDGSAAQFIKTDSDGNLQVDVLSVSGTTAVTQSTSPWIVAGGGTAGTAATGVVTVQGIASMTPVQVSQATAASLNCTEANSGAIKTAVEIMDDWDETNRAAVNTIAGQVGVQGGSGAVSALTQRVVLATDVALPTGTNSIGTTVAPFDEVHATGVTATGAGSTRNITTKPCKYFSVQVIHNSGAATWTVNIEGSLDGTNFSTIASHTQASLSATIVRNSTATPVLYWRYNVATLGASTNLDIHSLLME